MSDLGERVVAQARSYLGVPFWHAGRSKQGLDCIGLLAVVAHDLEITDFDDVNYAPEPDPAYLTAVLERFAVRKWQRLEPFQETNGGGRGAGFGALSLVPGNLLQFEILSSAQHCGIYAENERGEGTVIHTYQSAGKVVEHRFDVHWQRRLFAAYRWREG
jgi:cell wall-associated NlpC family hydrolase